MKATVSVEARRGCGFRKPASDGVGIYLVGGREVVACGRLPIALHVCNACGQGIKPARAWTWVCPRDAFDLEYCSAAKQRCLTCLVGEQMPERAGLIWVGEKYYQMPDDFVREAALMGVSRKISALPRDFVVGATVVYLAHRKAVPQPDGDPHPGIFTAFVPQRVDLVIENAEQVSERALHIAAAIAKRAVVASPVRIVQVVPESQTELKLETNE